MQLPRITIITPSFNQVDFIERTIKSVVEQRYPNLEYIVIDGGSTDGSVEIIGNYNHLLSYWVSEKDNGMYEALQKGFAKSTGEIMGWINSDDVLGAGSLFRVAETFAHPSVYWIQGQHAVIDEHDRVVYQAPPRLLCKYSYYKKQYHGKPFGFIQQEGTFWRRTLWEKAGGHISQQYRLAGDFELWMRFFRHADLHLMPQATGYFRRRNANQLSVDNYPQYLAEADHIIDAHLTFDAKVNILILRLLKRMSRLPLLGTVSDSLANRLSGTFKPVPQSQWLKNDASFQTKRHD